MYILKSQDRLACNTNDRGHAFLVYLFYDSCLDFVLLFTQPASRPALPRSAKNQKKSQNVINQPLSLLWQLTPNLV